MPELLLPGPGLPLLGPGLPLLGPERRLAPGRRRQPALELLPGPGLSLLAPGRAAGIPFLGVVLVLVPPLHMYRQLRGAYALGRGAALWRTGALLTIAVAALLAFAVLILAQTGG